MAQKVIWSEAAETDLEDLLLFWIEHNKSTTYSIKLSDIIKKAVALIAIMPLLGKATDIENVRCLVKENYSIFYELSTKSIIILRIWDNRQDPERLQYK